MHDSVYIHLVNKFYFCLIRLIETEGIEKTYQLKQEDIVKSSPSDIARQVSH